MQPSRKGTAQPKLQQTEQVLWGRMVSDSIEALLRPGPRSNPQPETAFGSDVRATARQSSAGGALRV